MKADELKNKGIKAQEQQKIKKEAGDKKPRAKIEKTLLGELIGKEKVKVYDKSSEYYGSIFYKLKTRNIENMENDAPALVYAFKEVIINPEEQPTEAGLKRKEEIWRIIERDEYLGKRWIIYCY